MHTWFSDGKGVIIIMFSNPESIYHKLIQSLHILVCRVVYDPSVHSLITFTVNDLREFVGIPQSVEDAKESLIIHWVLSLYSPSAPMAEASVMNSFILCIY
jgi:hypothetical protein